MTAQEAFAEFEKMARDINPNLPADLRGHVLTISMSKDGQYAYTSPTRYFQLPKTE